jgi:hypothetical protein
MSKIKRTLMTMMCLGLFPLGIGCGLRGSLLERSYSAVLDVDTYPDGAKVYEKNLGLVGTSPFRKRIKWKKRWKVGEPEPKPEATLNLQLTYPGRSRENVHVELVPNEEKEISVTLRIPVIKREIPTVKKPTVRRIPSAGRNRILPPSRKPVSKPPRKSPSNPPKSSAKPRFEEKRSPGNTTSTAEKNRKSGVRSHGKTGHPNENLLIDLAKSYFHLCFGGDRWSAYRKLQPYCSNDFISLESYKVGVNERGESIGAFKLLTGAEVIEKRAKGLTLYSLDTQFSCTLEQVRGRLLHEKVRFHRKGILTWVHLPVEVESKKNGQKGTIHVGVFFRMIGGRWKLANRSYPTKYQTDRAFAKRKANDSKYMKFGRFAGAFWILQNNAKPFMVFVSENVGHTPDGRGFKQFGWDAIDGESENGSPIPTRSPGGVYSEPEIEKPKDKNMDLKLWFRNVPNEYSFHILYKGSECKHVGRLFSQGVEVDWSGGMSVEQIEFRIVGPTGKVSLVLNRGSPDYEIKIYSLPSKDTVTVIFSSHILLDNSLNQGYVSFQARAKYRHVRDGIKWSEWVEKKMKVYLIKRFE